MVPMGTSAARELAKNVMLSARVPVVVIVPPDNPCPPTIDVTVPGVVHDGTPEEFSVRTCDPVVLPASITHAVPFQYMTSPARLGVGNTAAVTHDGTPAALSDSTCVPLLLPGSVSHDA